MVSPRAYVRAVTRAIDVFMKPYPRGPVAYGKMHAVRRPGNRRQSFTGILFRMGQTTVQTVNVLALAGAAGRAARAAAVAILAIRRIMPFAAPFGVSDEPAASGSPARRLSGSYGWARFL
jgi:hypothetical protein